ncbi:MAG: RsiV family protein [Bacillota bacterium]
MSNSKNIFAQIADKQIKTPCVDFIYPQIENIVPTFDEAVKDLINTRIEQLVTNLLPQDTISETGECNIQVTGKGTVTVNKNGILSVRIEVFSIPIPAANGSTVLKALTFNLLDAHEYQFNELFESNTRYRIIVRNVVEAEIVARQIPLLAPVPPISDNQEYYLTENSVVVFFQELVFTPHFVGPPEFPIPFRVLRNVIRDDGPIAQLMDP